VAQGKSIDATMPLGPWITTVDEIATRMPADPVRGQRRAAAERVDRADGVPLRRLIAELSRGMTLRAATCAHRTPSGIGNAREPQVFLGDGDVVLTHVSGLGTLRNRVAQSSSRN